MDKVKEERYDNGQLKERSTYKMVMDGLYE